MSVGASCRVANMDNEYEQIKNDLAQISKEYQTKTLMLHDLAHKIKSSIESSDNPREVLRWYQEIKQIIDSDAFISTQILDVKGICEEICEDLNFIYEKYSKRIDLSWVGPELMLRKNEGMLRSMLFHILCNAFDHSGKNEISCQISHLKFDQRSQLFISTLTGAPVTICDPFERGLSSKMGIDRGRGLPIVRQIAQALGGNAHFLRDFKEGYFTISLSVRQ